MDLKQSTAATIKLGPFVDSGDGATAETGLTITDSEVRISKNGGDIAHKAQSDACVHDELGWYNCALGTGDTDTLGRLQIIVHETGALPVHAALSVITAAEYDRKYSTGATVATVASDLVVTQSDIKAVLSDLKVADANVDVVKSDLIVSQSDVKAVLSDLKVADTNVDVVKSDLIVSQSDVKAVLSDLVLTRSDVVTVQSDLAGLDVSGLSSDLAVVTSDLTILASDLVEVDVAALTSDVASVHSDLTILASDVTSAAADITVQTTVTE